MRVSEIMTKNPACCTPDSTLRDVARMMVEHDCGEIPVCEDRSGGGLVGVITDRDIVCRAVADGMDVNTTTADCCMTTPPVSASPDMSLDDVCSLMEENMIRRVPVVDESGCVCGIVSQADIACKANGYVIAEIVREVSKPTEDPSHVGTSSTR
ncbi:MAG: hypothetical protein QOJ65_1163 [Fimbriimonadaceae bacterium]|jgi:CBS domain-containing protein|nr:hypothetical protein [Fimbriimonadaceae bacterium]